MLSKRLVALAALLAFLSMTSGACGASESSEDDPCLIEGRVGISKIMPQNSGLPCKAIESITFVLPGKPGVYRLKGTGPEHGRTCRVYPRSELPLEIRCWRGKTHFEVRAVRRGN